MKKLLAALVVMAVLMLCIGCFGVLLQPVAHADPPGGGACTVKWYFNAEGPNAGSSGSSVYDGEVEDPGAIPSDDVIRLALPGTPIRVCIEQRVYDPEGNEYTVVDTVVYDIN